MMVIANVARVQGVLSDVVDHSIGQQVLDRQAPCYVQSILM